MPIRKILVPLSGRFDPDDPESLDWTALESGFAVAQQLAAHVEVLCVTAPPGDPGRALAAWVPNYGIEQLIEIIQQESAARHARARSAFEAALNGLDKRPAVTAEPSPGFSVEFAEQDGEIREVVGARGRLADLVVVANSPERWGWHYRPIFDAALRDTGRPLLVLPPKAPSSLGRRIAVAWNGSIEAARAVAALVDFAQPGAEVIVMSVQEDRPVVPGIEEVTDYLRWHGIAAKFFVLQGDARSSGDVILRFAATNNCDLLVMGACIHSRTHRVAFGSMTETVLAGAQFAALMVA